MTSKLSRLPAALILAVFSAGAVAQTCGPVTLLEDPAGDWDGTIGSLAGGGVGLTEQDLLSLTLAQSGAGDDALLTFRILTAGAPALTPLPQAAWFSSFETPDGVIYGVRLQSDETGAQSFFSYVVASNLDETITDGRFVVDGSEKPAEAGSEFGADGVITIIVKASNVGITGAGQTLGAFNAASLQSAIVPGAGGASSTMDEMPAGLGRDGFFDIQASCGGKSGIFGAGAVPAGLLLPLLLALLARRMRRRPLAVLLAAAFALPAAAADPASGTITDTQTSVEWTGGPYIVPNLTPALGEAFEDPVCEEGTETCDVFRFEINLTSANLDDDLMILTVEWNDSIPDDANPAANLPDYDLYLYNDDTGERVATQATAANPEAMFFIPANGRYRLDVIPFAAMNEPYTGKVQFVKFEEEKNTALSIFGGALGTGTLMALAGFAALARRRRES